MTRVKICGFREVEHALAAVQAGADYVAVMFAKSKRQVTVDKAMEIVAAVKSLNTATEAVGVFAGTSVEEVNRIAQECSLDRVQLSGGESWEFCKGLKIPFIKVAHVSANTRAESVIAEIEAGRSMSFDFDYICMLDTQVKGLFGGTGAAFDWRVAKAVASRYPVMIAGGLDLENVDTMIKEVNPWGVDVSSGVEEDGVKSIDKIEEFIKKVKSAAAEGE